MSNLIVTPTNISNLIVTPTNILPNTDRYKLVVNKLTDDACIPTKNNPSDAGYDLYSAVDVTIMPKSKELISTGITLVIPEGFYGRVASRSGLSVNYNLEVGAGVIDNGYRGEIKVVLRNYSNLLPYTVKKGDRIAQLIITPYYSPEIVSYNKMDVDQQHTSDRGTSGFGSSGK